MLPGGWPVWFLAACVLAALICMAAGAVAAASAAAVVRAHAKALVPSELLVKVRTAQDAVDRIEGMLPLIEVLVSRAQAAVDRITQSIAELRLALSLRR